ncbi:MAG: DUF1080 domain-containing protein [Opitutales bacterium]|nr:DUF1080 domain-containing protein [Opitutales bacterium]
MRTLLLLSACACLSAAEVIPPTPKQTMPVPSAEDTLDWKPMFDGKTLKGWSGDPKYWRCDDGAIVGEITPETIVKRNTFIIWDGARPGDFELKAEYRISDAGNSGINYHSADVAGLTFALTGPQADIDGQNKYTGQNYEERGRTFNALRGQITRIRQGQKAEVIGSVGDPKELASFIRNGDWNEYHLIVRGGTQIHILNGHVMSVVIDDDAGARHPEGKIGVQVHVGPPMKVEYRNLRIRQP